MSGLTGLEAEALRLYGLPNTAVDAINSAIPAAERMIGIVGQAQPMIDEAQTLFAKAQPLITEGLALYAKAQPLIAQANAELKTIMPAALAVRSFLQAREAVADVPVPQSNNVP